MYCVICIYLDSQSKIWLEDEYIKRYIGELTPLQESKLVQFKKQLSQLQKSKVIFSIELICIQRVPWGFTQFTQS